jgi:hypothetical protein
MFLRYPTFAFRLSLALVAQRTSGCRVLEVCGVGFGIALTVPSGPTCRRHTQVPASHLGILLSSSLK